MPAKSKSQQRLFGMVHAYQKGKLKDAPESVKEIARSISDEDAEHFAKTKHKGLPEKKEKKAADRLYTYLPKDNTALTDGLLSTALSDKGFEKYRGRTGKYKKEDVLKVLDSWEPEWTRSKAISALAEPIPEDAAEDFLEFARNRKLYSFDTKDLIKAKILAHIRRARKGGGTDPVDEVKKERPNWHSKKKHLLFQGVPHYFVETTGGKIPPEFVTEEKKAAAPSASIAASPAGTTSAKTPAPAVPYPAEGPRGFKQHNPGNLQSNGKTLWEGATGVPAKGEDLTFVDPKYGIRAMARLAYNYKAKHGIDTPRKFLKRYAKTTDYTNYLKHIKDKTGFGADQAVDFTNVDTLQKFIPAVGSFEIGPKYWNTYSPSVVSNAVLSAIPLASVGRKVAK